ncbi:MAG: MFS transporter [Mycobacteriales bacterium]|nr:MAG: MFS transporter [Pseudonocardiales bacterium]
MFRSLHTHNYRLFAAGQVVSNTGSWMQRVAQDWLVLNLSHNSGTALGIVTALQFVPTLALGLWGGVVADRYDKRRLLMGTQLCAGLTALTLGVLDLTGAVQIWHVFVLAAALGLVTVVDNPTRQSFAVEMVGRADVGNAVSLNSAIFNSARIVGPAVAGLLISTVGTGQVFLINGASYLAVISSLALMRESELHKARPLPRASGQLREGLAYVRSRRDLMLPLLLVFVVATLGLNFQITIALMAKSTFHTGAESYGLLSTAIAVGSLGGALVSSRRSVRPRLRLLLGAAFAFGLLETTSALMPTYLLFAIVLMPTGLAALLFTTAANSSMQIGAGPRMRGRVMALYLLAFMGGAPFGSFFIGWLAQATSPRASIALGGLASMGAAVVLGLALARREGITVEPRPSPLPHLHLLIPDESSLAHPAPFRLPRQW